MLRDQDIPRKAHILLPVQWKGGDHSLLWDTQKQTEFQRTKATEASRCIFSNISAH